MKKIALLLCFAIIFGAQAKIIDKIAIIVNNRAVTYHELEKLYQIRSSELYRKYAGKELAEKLEALKKQVIKDKTDELLLLEKASQEGITISDEMMDNFIKGLMKQNNIENEEQFNNILMQQMGMTLKQFKETQKTQYIARTVIQQFVINKIVIDEAEIRAYYDEHIDDYKTPFTYSIQEIVLYYDSTTKLFVENRAKSIVEELKSGKLDFSTAVSLYSEASSKELNGELKNLKLGDLNKKLEEAALKLKVGEVAMVELPDSIHIVKLIERNEPKPLPFEKVRDKIEDKLRQPLIQDRIDKFMEELRSIYYVRIDVKPEELK
ncbi:peptidyl-prolyl cis-trans isomerase SurA [Thermotomaculum hydrothermale]|uniref:peptidylprolyl isomerase n=1 Tax=Thermotomaculum hydrothermale TaxID=981385 RepID=A0A7R6SYB2_9BACT|nr:peptidyl-prolyl cis-trans isomerase [Thermotomaculum hydrothermale]BBB31695.1 peptidyl-prolyl cis-trans isomerase SurA [Thermotomaculum hydrothermale]